MLFGVGTGIICFYDRAIAANLIIITSPYNPVTFYCQTGGGNRVDNAEQLLRRITLILEMTKDTIYNAIYLPPHDHLFHGAVIRDKDNTRKNIYSRRNKTDSPINSLAILEEMVPNLDTDSNYSTMPDEQNQVYQKACDSDPAECDPKGN